MNKWPVEVIPNADVLYYRVHKRQYLQTSCSLPADAPQDELPPNLFRFRGGDLVVQVAGVGSCDAFIDGLRQLKTPRRFDAGFSIFSSADGDWSPRRPGSAFEADRREYEEELVHLVG